MTVKTSYWSCILYGWHLAHLFCIQLPSSFGLGWALEAKESVERAAAFIVKLFRGAGIIAMRFVCCSRFLISNCSVNLRFEPIAAAAGLCLAPRPEGPRGTGLVSCRLCRRPTHCCGLPSANWRSGEALDLQHVFTIYQLHLSHLKHLGRLSPLWHP